MLPNIKFLLISAFALLSSAAVAQTNIIRNGTFEDVLTHWTVEQHAPALADPVVTSDGPEGVRTLSIEVVEPDAAEAWKISLLQSGLNLKATKRYRVSFLAKSTSQRWICAALAQHLAPYKSLASDANIEVGPEWKSVVILLRPSADEPSGRFTITNLAKTSGSIWLTNISVIEE
jgi:hypothetical protein